MGGQRWWSCIFKILGIHYSIHFHQNKKKNLEKHMGQVSNHKTDDRKNATFFLKKICSFKMVNAKKKRLLLPALIFFHAYIILSVLETHHLIQCLKVGWHMEELVLDMVLYNDWTDLICITFLLKLIHKSFKLQLLLLDSSCFSYDRKQDPIALTEYRL